MKNVCNDMPKNEKNPRNDINSNDFNMSQSEKIIHRLGSEELYMIQGSPALTGLLCFVARDEAMFEEEREHVCEQNNLDFNFARIQSEDIIAQNNDNSNLNTVTPLDTGRSDKDRKIKLCFAITNARSLWKKINSLCDAHDELGIDLSIVTETWFYKAPALEKVVCDAENGRALTLINNYRNRQGRTNGGGGVSIVFNKNRLTGKEYNIKRSGHEIVAAKLRVKGDSRPLFVLGIYLSTRLTAAEANKGIQTLIIAINKIKTEHENPYVIVGGDFNNFDHKPILDDFADIELHITPPTRGGRTLDLALTNIEAQIHDHEIHPPLRNDENQTDSDHKLVVYYAAWSHSHAFKWITKRKRALTEENVRACIDCLLYTSPSPRDS